MANEYGRGDVVKKAQRGGGLKYRQFSPEDVEARLKGSELGEYRAALEQIGSPVSTTRGGEVTSAYRKKYDEAMATASRLRDLASTRAFIDFSKEAMQYSKPWKYKAPSEGLIKEQKVHSSLMNAPVGDIARGSELRTYTDQQGNIQYMPNFGFDLSREGGMNMLTGQPSQATQARLYSSQYGGTHTFGRVGYDEAAQARRRLRREQPQLLDFGY